MELRAALSGRSSAEAASALVREWLHRDIVLDFDDPAAPVGLGELRALVTEAPGWSRHGRELDIAVAPTIDDIRPGTSAWVLTGDHGIWWRSPDEDRLELWDDDLGVYVLGGLLQAIRISAPVQLEIAVDGTLGPLLATLGHFYDTVNRRIGAVVDRWYAADDVLVKVDQPVTRAWFIARHRDPVDRLAASVPGRRTWWSIDGIHEPETDHVVGERPGIHRGAGLAGDVRVALTTPDPAQALERFLATWYGEPLPPAPPGDVGGLALLARASACERAQGVFGGEDRFLGVREQERTEDGFTVMIEAHQYVWLMGYRPGDPDPVMFTLSTDSDERWSTGLPMSRYLLRRAVEVAITSAPFYALTWTVDAAAANAALEHFTPVLPAAGDADDLLGGFPTVFSDGKLLVTCRVKGDDVLVMAGAHRREDIASTSLARLPGWWWHRHAAAEPTNHETHTRRTT